MDSCCLKPGLEGFVEGDLCCKLEASNLCTIDTDCPDTDVCEEGVCVKGIPADVDICEYRWTPWTECSAKCGYGVKTRTMVITANRTTEAGIPCPYEDGHEDEQQCTRGPCAADLCEDMKCVREGDDYPCQERLGLCTDISNLYDGLRRAHCEYVNKPDGTLCPEGSCLQGECMYSSPTESPTTSRPSSSPTESPTSKPSSSPTKSPTSRPSSSPTKSPTSKPSSSPTKSPTSSKDANAAVDPAKDSDDSTNYQTAFFIMVGVAVILLILVCGLYFCKAEEEEFSKDVEVEMGEKKRMPNITVSGGESLPVAMGSPSAGGVSTEGDARLAIQEAGLPDNDTNITEYEIDFGKPNLDV